ncbi:hypothetical protein BDC45DRAFT_574282, partial [Circinella umbellata]
MSCVLRTFRCHFCNEDSSTRTSLYNHLKKHQVPGLPQQLPVNSDKPRGSGFYKFISTTTIQQQPNLLYSLVFVCCICNNLHDSVTELNNHFEIHLVSSDQSAELSLPSSSTTPTITTPRPEITTKRPYTDNINTGSKIKIIKSQKTITFDTTLASKIIPLNTPKISKVDREKLSDIYTFIMQTYDKMTQEELSVIRKHQDDQ